MSDFADNPIFMGCSWIQMTQHFFLLSVFIYAIYMRISIHFKYLCSVWNQEIIGLVEGSNGTLDFLEIRKIIIFDWWKKLFYWRYKSFLKIQGQFLTAKILQDRLADGIFNKTIQVPNYRTLKINIFNLRLEEFMTKG